MFVRNMANGDSLCFGIRDPFVKAYGRKLNHLKVELTRPAQLSVTAPEDREERYEASALPVSAGDRR